MVFNPSSSGALILNAGYEPIQIVNWQKAIILWLQDKVDVLEFHTYVVRSPSRSFRIPSVIRLKRYIRPYLTSFEVRLSRQNIFVRDKMVCQYCWETFPERKLTVDHVTPLSRGGRHSWTNVVTACSSCNNRKGDKTPDEAQMRLLNQPVRPRWLPSRELSYKTDSLPDSWQIYLISERVG